MSSSRRLALVLLLAVWASPRPLAARPGGGSSFRSSSSSRSSSSTRSSSSRSSSYSTRSSSSRSSSSTAGGGELDPATIELIARVLLGLLLAAPALVALPLVIGGGDPRRRK